ncbi:MAG: ATP-binding cassette domain-containing protein [Acidobacteriota bacterium]|nr:ATP-binding cassette domain-containing protein [Acidobacteriota bacterium]
MGGAVTALVGPNGAGKSSTLLSIYGSVRSEGSITVDGEDVSRLTPAARARRGIAVVPQGRRLFPRLSVQDNLRVMAETLKLSGRTVVEALDRFPNLKERARVPAGVLSGGEQQMLVVSRALMGSPRVLLLDEMMTGLAPRIVHELATTVSGLASDGVAILLAEPALGILSAFVTRGYVLIRGEIVASDEEGGRALERAYQSALGMHIGAVGDDVGASGPLTPVIKGDGQ